VITYPSTGDPQADAALSDTFRKFELIRLPVELGGDKPQASSFVAFSKVCVHLECSPNYNPAQIVNPSENGYEAGPGYGGHQNFECPCHGSIYRIPDGLSVEGPASLQPPPANAVPMLTLSIDERYHLWVEPPVWDVHHNGELGYGRYVQNQS
jgi:ubiquinol-cytochrome c reductase iron-sulfur subunit